MALNSPRLGTLSKDKTRSHKQVDESDSIKCQRVTLRQVDVPIQIHHDSNLGFVSPALQEVGPSRLHIHREADLPQHTGIGFPCTVARNVAVVTHRGVGADDGAGHHVAALLQDGHICLHSKAHPESPQSRGVRVTEEKLPRWLGWLIRIGFPFIGLGHTVFQDARFHLELPLCRLQLVEVPHLDVRA